MSFLQRTKYLLSKESIRRCMKRRFSSTRGRIKLAVAGSSSSGKSFLLMDIIASLRKMGANCDAITDDLQFYRKFGAYKPDENGGFSRTPLYACRQENHYGASVSGNSAIDSFKIDFLNIPGEIFKKAEPGHQSRLEAYINLRTSILSTKRIFVVSEWKTVDGNVRFIVEPSSDYNSATESDRSSTETIHDQARVTNYMNWRQLYAELNDCHYQKCPGSTHRISGKKLLKRFFEYDTDSVMMTLEDLLKKKIIKPGFDPSDFRNQKYDNSFTFFLYCSEATDIVLCDRIFKKRLDNEEMNQEMDFGDMAEGIYEFYEKYKEGKEKHFYLAFRNIDYLLFNKESAYKHLYTDVLKKCSKSDRLNIIYSLFNYAMLHYIEPQISIVQEEFCDFIGIDPSLVQVSDLPDQEGSICSDIEKLTEELVDVSGHDGVVHNEDNNLATHILSVIGAKGQSFRLLLLKSQEDIEDKNDPHSLIVPHVYFSCTPVTENFDVFENFTTNVNGVEIVASDFMKKGEKGQSFFRHQHSNACFGSYQLCMDILTRNGKGTFNHGSLLRILQGLG